MKKAIAYLALLMMNGMLCAGPVSAQGPFKAAKELVANYFDAKYGSETGRYAPEDLNRRYEILDILTGQPIKNSIENGAVYFCAMYGDDACGIYLLLENDVPELVTVRTLPEYQVFWDFIYRNGYTREQMNTCVEFIVARYEYEVSVTVH